MNNAMYKTIYTDQMTNFINDYSCKDINKKNVNYINYNDGSAHWSLQPWGISFY
jgi:hypothetical protein